jgi:hypothetical protein
LTTVSWPSGLVHVAHRGICMPPFLTSLKIPIRRRERNCRVAIDAEHDRVDLIVNLKTVDAPATKATFENTPICKLSAANLAPASSRRRSRVGCVWRRSGSCDRPMSEMVPGGDMAVVGSVFFDPTRCAKVPL